MYFSRTFFTTSYVNRFDFDHFIYYNNFNRGDAMVQVNPENFPKESAKLTKKLKGPILAGTIAASVTVFGSQALFHVSDQNTEQPSDLLSDRVISVSTDDINDLNLIVNDNDCGNAFFVDICDYLEKQGLDFITSKQNDNLKYEDATIITLDQQMMSGEGITFIGPKQDGTANHSEALLKAMQVTFHTRGWDTTSEAGIAEYQTLDNGEISYVTVPSPTEVDSLDSSAQVTVAIGTTPDGYTTQKIAEDLMLSLARYQDYLKNVSNYVQIDKNATGLHMQNDNSYYFNDQINNASSFSPSLVVEVQRKQVHSK